MHTFCFLCIKTAHLEVICAVCRDVVGLFLCGNMNGSGGQNCAFKAAERIDMGKGVASFCFLIRFSWFCNLRHIIVQSASSQRAICVKLHDNLCQVTSSFDASYKAFGQRTSFKAFADMISYHFNEWRINCKTTTLFTGKACLLVSL